VTLPEERAERRQGLQTQRRRRRRNGVVALVGAAICFALGVAFGQALEDGRKGGGAVTYERTLKPVTVAPNRSTTGRAGKAP